jgi:glutamate/tyrosine decarboxylase-like PLP-dependent enzyme
MPDDSTRTDILARALRHAQAYLENLDDAPVATTIDVAELRARLGKPLPQRGVPADQVLDELVRDAAPGLLRSAGGRFFGWVLGGALPAAIAADWLATVWDQNAALYACSPSAAIAEEVAGAWLKDLLDLPRHSSFAFVTGCQMAHVTCLAAGRTLLLRKRGWDVGEQGLGGAPQIRILANAQAHASIARAATLLGLGRANIVPLATDALNRVTFDALQDALVLGEPTIVVLQAGDIATGAFDRFRELIPLAKSADAWVHIDGAFGLWARSSAIHRDLTQGVENADSWATDGHKLLNTPFDCGYAFVAHPDDHKAALSLRASYLTHAEDARDEIDWNPEWSRRARGFATYAALRNLGREGVAELFDRCCRHACAIAEAIRTLPGAELVSAPVVNQALVRFRDQRECASEQDHDRRTDTVIAAINRDGEAFFTGCDWRGRRVMRISVCNWRTDDEALTRTIAAVRFAVLANQSADLRGVEGSDGAGFAL